MRIAVDREHVSATFLPLRARRGRLDGVGHIVVGIMPPGFDFPYDVEL